MKLQDIGVLAAFGLIIWIVGTLYYAYRGPAVLESTPSRYWVSFAISPILSGLICVAVLRWLHIPPGSWASATLLLAIPGMIGEAIVLSNFAVFMPKLQPASGGPYGAFLFATYALVLGLAEVVSLRAAS